MTAPSILIAGVGNIFKGDDAFGVEVARLLAARKLPEGVRVVDFGIRGFDLGYALMDDQDVTILVDATARGGEPGTIYTIEPDLNDLEAPDSGAVEVEMHGMNPMSVLSMVRANGGSLKRILLVGCEPATFGPDEGLMGLSEPVAAAVHEAVAVVESLIGRIVDEHGGNDP